MYNDVPTTCFGRCSWYVIVHTNTVVFSDCYTLIIDLL